MEISQQARKTHWLTVGAKILFGVALVSNIFIGSLLYINLHASATVEQTVTEVLLIREELSSHLRTSIVDLQKEFLALPSSLKRDGRQQILDSVEQDFHVMDSQVLKGRENYSPLYSRTERRDLAGKNFVVQSLPEGLFFSYGMFDDKGVFTESVTRKHLSTTNPAEDLSRLNSLVASAANQSETDQASLEIIKKVNEKAADVALKAEATRNEILYKVDEISAKEQQLTKTRQQQRRFTLGMGILAILANIVVLYFLVRIIVERPLLRLTHTIEEIRSGRFPEVPCSDRRDQIGVLSSAISNFREALLNLQTENHRKVREKSIVDTLIETIASVVNALECRARELVQMSTTLKELATTAGAQSGSVAMHASETAEHTAGVSFSTQQLRSVMETINQQVEVQDSIVQGFINKNKESHVHIGELNLSIKDINEIISMVQEITEHTKLLALNATIEAARAGDKGKGFAVVATEVRELSLRTERATADVMNRVQAIQRASSTLITNLRDIDERVVDLTKVTANIATAVNDQQQVTGTITDLVGQTSENTRTVSASINEVNSAANRTRLLSDQVHQHANEIAQQLTMLLNETTTRLQLLGDNNTTHLSETIPTSVGQVVFAN